MLFIYLFLIRKRVLRIKNGLLQVFSVCSSFSGLSDSVFMLSDRKVYFKDTETWLTNVATVTKQLFHFFGVIVSLHILFETYVKMSIELQRLAFIVVAG